MPYVSSTLGTYSTGTVTVVNGSTTVTGSGTVWGDIVNEGDLFTIDDDKFYYVAALNSDTSLTLDKPYAESSASGINYRVMLNTAAHFPSDVAAKVERALSGMGDVYCPINHASSGSDYGLASASLYGHAKASETTPKAPGTAAVGTETNKFARGDHVHPHDDTKLDKTGGAFNKMLFSQTSGNYVAPYTGVYRITLKGGGGGGGGAQTDRYATGGAGGEGGTIIFYATLTKNQSYAYTIGAGGAAGANGAGNTDAQNGSNGGTSSIVIGSTTYSITGGGGGRRRFSNGRGGFGGRVKTPASNSVYMIPGMSGGNGTAVLPDSITASGYISTLVQGPGCSLGNQPSLYGGGGNGGGPAANSLPTTVAEPTAGGDGYILIEYAG